MKITKLLTIAILTLCSINIHAKKERIKGNGNIITSERTTDSYDKIASSGSFDIVLVSGTEGKLSIEIEENLVPYLLTEVKNNELKIHWKRGANISHKKSVKITIPIKDINSIAQSGSGSVVSETVIKDSDLTLKISGSGKFNLKVDSSNLTSHLSGSGRIELNGSTDTFLCNVSGSGSIGGYDLIINKNIDANISGSGNIKATVNGTLNAKVSGSGNLRYKGKPTKEIVKVSGSGKVSSY